jgi:hypothetical protein
MEFQVFETEPLMHFGNESKFSYLPFHRTVQFRVLGVPHDVGVVEVTLQLGADAT